MIGHGIDLNDGLIFAVNDTGNISVEFLFVLFWDRGLSSFDSENDVNVELGIGISHDVFPLVNFSHVAPLGLWLLGVSPGYKHIAPLGLWVLGDLVFYKHIAPLGLNMNASNVECPYKYVAPLGLKASPNSLRITHQTRIIISKKC